MNCSSALTLSPTGLCTSHQRLKHAHPSTPRTSSRTARHVGCTLSTDGTFPYRRPRARQLDALQAVANADSFHPSYLDLSAAEKQRLIDAEIAKINKQTAAREEQLRQAALKTHLDHELRFGKLMLAQEKFTTAIRHFDKVLDQCEEDTDHHGEARLQKAACLDSLGRADEARRLYESLLHYRGAHHHIKRRAAQVLFAHHTPAPPRAHSSADPSAQLPPPSPLDDYMYRMFVSGFGALKGAPGGAAPAAAAQQLRESRGERVLLQVLPWTVVMVAPLLVLVMMTMTRGR